MREHTREISQSICALSHTLAELDKIRDNVYQNKKYTVSLSEIDTIRCILIRELQRANSKFDTYEEGE